MTLYLDVAVVPWEVVYALFLAFMLYLFWVPIPNNVGWPIFRGRDGFCYFIWIGGQTGEGTRGIYERPLLVFKGFHIDEKTGNIQENKEGEKEDKGILGLGIYWIGFLHRVEKMHNKWAELVDGKLVKRDAYEYGFSTKENSMAYEALKVEDAGNIPFDFTMLYYWMITNPEKAKRRKQDTHVVVLERLAGAFIAWAKTKQIYHPAEDDKSDVAKTTDTTQIRDKFWEEANKPKLREFSVDTAKKMGIDIEELDVKKKKDGKEFIKTRISLLQEISGVYGYTVTDLAISSVEPGAGFAEALAASIKARLEGTAALIRARYRKLSELEALEAALLWGQAAEEVKGTALGQMAQSFRDYGVPPFFDASALEKWFQSVIPDAGKEELKETVDKLMQDIAKARSETKT